VLVNGSRASATGTPSSHEATSRPLALPSPLRVSLLPCPADGVLLSRGNRARLERTDQEQPTQDGRKDLSQHSTSERTQPSVAQLLDHLIRLPLPITRPPSWPIGEDEATRLALPHLGMGRGRSVRLRFPNSHVGAPAAGLSGRSGPSPASRRADYRVRASGSGRGGNSGHGSRCRPGRRWSRGRARQEHSRCG